MAERIALQQTVISLLTGRDPIQNLVHPHHGTLLQSSSSARQNSINALAEQYQRMLQSARINQSAQSPSGGPPNCGGKIKMSNPRGRVVKFECTSCRWEDESYHKGGVNGLFLEGVSSGGSTIREEVFTQRFHRRDEKRKYCCCVCREDKVYNFWDMRSHCRSHSKAEIMG